MDMIVSAGKSRKNVEAYVLLPPDAKMAIELLLETRNEVGIPQSNDYIFARMSADTPFTGNEELQEIVQQCPGLQHPERIKTTALRRYIATVSQVSLLLPKRSCEGSIETPFFFLFPLFPLFFLRFSAHNVAKSTIDIFKQLSEREVHYLCEKEFFFFWRKVEN
jgi:hypothetical protein